MRERLPAVYIMTNKPKGVLYTGVTSNLIQRVYQHKAKQIKGFTEKYNCDKLVFFEICERMDAAIAREKQIKGWLREKKIALVESINPAWKDLYEDIL